MCEAVPRVDVVVRRKPSPRIIPARASWSRGFPPPRASRRPSRVACLIYLFLVAICRRPRRGGGRRAGGRRGGRRRRARGGGAIRTETSAGTTARGGATRGTVSHTNAPPRRPSRLTDCPVLPTLLRAACPAGTETGRSGGVDFRPPPHFAHTKNRRSENVEITIRQAPAASSSI